MSQGTLLLCINNAWGTICEGDGWSYPEAQVVCNSLGFTSDGATYYASNTGSLAYTIFTRHFSCLSSENTLSNCMDIANTEYVSHCAIHYYDVGVQCVCK